jgi:type IV pilus assembly protein PilN
VIRINLLPQARKGAAAARPGAATAPGGQQGWAIAYLLGAFLWAIGLAGVYYVFSSRLDEQLAKNAALSSRIDQIKTQSAGLDDCRGAIGKSQELEEVVGQLQRARLGPTRVLMEMSRILSENGGPTIDPQRLEQLRRENPLAGFNQGWDARRLWVTTFNEDAREVRITGVGKTNEDVAEFLRRLALSDVFENVTLTKTESVTDATTQLSLIGFELNCRVRY